jgi:hypothetical protein
MRSQNNYIDRVFVFAAEKDYSVLEYSLPSIKKYIKAKSYFLVCDNVSFSKFFVKNNPISGFKLLSENEILGSTLSKVNLITTKSLRSWYKQQILKLILIDSSNQDEVVLIWDGDTIPLKPLNFLKNNTLGYYISNEFHHPYHNTINYLLGFQKPQNHSFIAQCFVVRVYWIKLMIKSIESRYKCSYIDSIIKIANTSKLQNFSEYETMAAFIQRYFFFDTFIINNKWFRYGYSICGSPANAYKMKENFDYISFESWDSSTLRSIIIRIIFAPSLLIYYIKKNRKR